MLTRYRDACNTCGHAAIVSFNSATPAQLITHGHYDPTGWHHGAGHVQYSRVMRHDDFTLLTPCKTSLATPSHYDPRYCIWLQPLWDHLSGPGSQCNCPILSYKRLTQAVGQKKAHAHTGKADLSNTTQFSRRRRVLCSNGLNHVNLRVHRVHQ
jgi:hypothetical protein